VPSHHLGQVSPHVSLLPLTFLSLSCLRNLKKTASLPTSSPTQRKPGPSENGSKQLWRGVTGLNPFRSLLTKKKNTKPRTQSLEMRPIFLSSGSIDIFQCGTYGASHRLAGAREQPRLSKGKQDSRDRLRKPSAPRGCSDLLHHSSVQSGFTSSNPRYLHSSTLFRAPFTPLFFKSILRGSLEIPASPHTIKLKAK